MVTGLKGYLKCSCIGILVHHTNYIFTYMVINSMPDPGADPEGGLWGLETPLPRSVLFLNKRSMIIIWGAK